MFKIVVYLGSIVLANLLVNELGPDYTPHIALALIGLDLTLRDRLHDSWKTKLKLKMGALILVGSLLSFIINKNTQQTAIASFVAFACAATLDAVMYSLLGQHSRRVRVNGSNIISAAADSVLFLVIAFGLPLPVSLILKQYIAKVGGGYIWYRLIHR